MKTIISKSAAQTAALGKTLALKIQLPAILALWGELGTGKTQFTKGAAWGLGIKHPIQSPTFVLQKTYSFQRKNKLFRLCHYDFYRLKKFTETQNLDLFETLLDPNTLNIIEWPAVIYKQLPAHTYSIYFTHGKTPNERKIRLPKVLAKLLA
jgi:tRNA threonylcarbamoyladenosine biosynthesis protein TsaE